MAYRIRKEDAVEYKNPDVVERIMIETERNQGEAELLFRDTLMFLWVASVAGNPVSPPKAIDEGWHAFLLFTRDYAAFCREYLGKDFLHHCPYTSKVKAKPNFEIDAQNSRTLTLDVLRREFGDTQSINWRAPTAGCGADCDGSGGCSDCFADCNCAIDCRTG